MTTRANNTAQARVIDPILSTHALGYANAEMIAPELFPFANIPARGAKIIKFGKEAFRRLNTRRAPGGNKKRIQYGYEADSVALHGHDLEALVPFEHMEDAALVPGIDLAATSINMVLDVIMLGKEAEAAGIATDPNNYAANNKMALAGAAQWSDEASDPLRDILDAREDVRKRIGRYPNKLIVGATVFKTLQTHPKIVDRYKYVSQTSITADMLANLFEVSKLVVGKAVYLPEDAGDDVDALDVWGNVAILAYVPEGNNYRVPSFGYTYRKTGHPLVMTPYMENNADSWIYPVKYEYRPILTSADAGFLFSNVVGAV